MTYLAVAAALAALGDGIVERIVLCRPAVEAGERLGFLPGDLREKVDPYLRPLYDALGAMMDAQTLRRRLEQGTIEVAPLAFLRRAQSCPCLYYFGRSAKHHARADENVSHPLGRWQSVGGGGGSVAGGFTARPRVGLCRCLATLCQGFVVGGFCFG